MADQTQGDRDPDRALEEANAQRAELQRSLEVANAERAQLRDRLAQLERKLAQAGEGGPSETQAGAPGEAPGAKVPVPSLSEPARALSELVAQAEVQRRALAGLISDAGDVHRALTGGLGSRPPAKRGDAAPLRRVVRSRLAASPIGRPVRAIKRRRRAHAARSAAGDSGSDRGGRAEDPSPPAAAGADSVIRLAGPPVAVEVEGLAKSFTVPSKQFDSLKERLVRHPFTRIERRRLDVLRDVSFTVAQGEFIGLVGTNGAGKSTLLKAIAGIYQADQGTVRVAGRVAPLIELGVGFRADLSAHDNVILSATMLGLAPEVARERYPAVLEFAGLEEFAELKLRNYSSGMRVRLAFAVMMQVEADVFLIDEVLSVGDAEFQERCTQAMRELHEAGKTIFFVSHSMGKVKANCERGILLDEGRVEMIGTPDALAERYAELIATRRKEDRADRLPSLPAIGGTGGR